MIPRNLKILRVDDKLPATAGGDPTTPQRDVPRGPIDILDSGGITAINSLRTCARFWADFGGYHTADLIVGDVYFGLDLTTPLALVFGERKNHIPTGLSHLKAFAAAARVGRYVQGIGLHTAHAGWWAELAASQEEVHRCMAYLAAHEIGELAALLDGEQLVEAATKEKTLEPYWDWLKTKSRPSFDAAWKLAVRNFRERLVAAVAPPAGKVPEVFVSPDEYCEVLKWCEQMRNKPRPLGPEADRGIAFFYADGKPDCLYISSLFADVDGVSTKVLDGAAFDTAAAPTAGLTCEADSLPVPRIGAYLWRFGTLSAIYYEAARVLDEFYPCSPDELKNVDVSIIGVPFEGGSLALKRGFAVVFQMIRLHKALFETWEDMYLNDEWEPRGCEFVGYHDRKNDTLEEVLQRLLGLVRQSAAYQRAPSRRSPFTRDEVLVQVVPDKEAEGGSKLVPVKWVKGLEVGDVNKAWVKFHFRRLVEAGLLEPVSEEDAYKLISNRKQVGTPPVPAQLPGNRPILPALGLPATMKIWLKQSLGIAPGDDNTIPRILHAAFVHQAPAGETPEKSGNEFRNRLENGNGPAWLLKVCREYAEKHLKCSDPNMLPPWLSNS